MNLKRSISKRGDYCFCDDDTLPENTKVSSKGCNAVCTGDTKITCGGWVQVAVYSSTVKCMHALQFSVQIKIFVVVDSVQAGSEQ